MSAKRKTPKPKHTDDVSVASEFIEFVDSQRQDKVPLCLLFTTKKTYVGKLLARDRKVLGVCCPIGKKKNAKAAATADAVACPQGYAWFEEARNAECTLPPMIPRIDLLGMYARAAQEKVQAVCRTRGTKLNKTMQTQKGFVTASLLQNPRPGELGLFAAKDLAPGDPIARYLCEVKMSHLFPDTPYSISFTTRASELKADLFDLSVPGEVYESSDIVRHPESVTDWRDFLHYESMTKAGVFIPPFGQMANEPLLREDANCKLHWILGITANVDQTNVRTFKPHDLDRQIKGMIEEMESGRRVFLLGLLKASMAISTGSEITWCYDTSYEDHRRRAGYTACHSSQSDADAALAALAMETPRRPPVMAHVAQEDTNTYLFRLGDDTVLELSDFLVQQHHLQALFDYLGTHARDLRSDPCVWPIWTYLRGRFGQPDAVDPVPFPEGQPCVTFAHTLNPDQDGEYEVKGIFGHSEEDEKLYIFIEWSDHTATKVRPSGVLYCPNKTFLVNEAFRDYIRDHPRLARLLPDYNDRLGLLERVLSTHEQFLNFCPFCMQEVHGALDQHLIRAHAVPCPQGCQQGPFVRVSDLLLHLTQYHYMTLDVAERRVLP